MNEELFSTYFTEGMRRMIGIILRFNSWISKHCSQYRSDFQHKDFFSVLEQHLFFCSVQFSSVIQLCSTLCNPMNHSTPGLSAHQQLPESTQTHVHRVSDAIQPSHPLSSPSPPALNLSRSFQMSQLFASGGQNTGASASASVLPMNTQD